jgi:hypothetical protein
MHCHSIENETTNLKRGTLEGFLQQYYSRNGRQLTIITTFREPIERHVSSFFQWHGEGVIRKNIYKQEAETIIYQRSITELQNTFIHELHNQTLAGFRESIHELCEELKIPLAELHYCTEEEIGIVEKSCWKLFLFRFDKLIREGGLERHLSTVTGKPIKQHDANMSTSKWYRDIYATFKASLKIPRKTIIDIYESKRSIFCLMYPGQYDDMLSDALLRYQ